MKINNIYIPNRIVEESSLLQKYVSDIENQYENIEKELEYYFIENDICVECFEIFMEDGYINLLQYHHDEDKMDLFIKLFEFLHMKHPFFHYVKPKIYPRMSFLKKYNYIHGIYYFFFSFIDTLSYQNITNSIYFDLSTEWFYYICYHHYIHTITLSIIYRIIQYNRYDLFEIIFSDDMKLNVCLYISFDYKIFHYIIYQQKYSYMKLLLENSIVPDYLSFIYSIEKNDMYMFQLLSNYDQQYLQSRTYEYGVLYKCIWILDILWENNIKMNIEDELVCTCISNHSKIKNKNKNIMVLQWLLNHLYPVSYLDLSMCIHKKQTDLYFILFEHCKLNSLLNMTKKEYDYLIKYALEYKLDKIVFHLYEHPEYYISGYKNNQNQFYTDI
jgi:hypothetical protein